MNDQKSITKHSDSRQETALTIVANDAQIQKTQSRLNEVLAIKQQVFQEGIHFGPPYKGAKNDTLLKPGATFLQQKYGLRESHERIETTIHVDPADPAKSYVIIQDRCRIIDAATGDELSQADAACTTFEDKYLFRGSTDRTCPDCGKPSIMKSKYPPKDNPNAAPGWYCNPKSGGCGSSFAANDETITGQEVGKAVNTNPLNLLDTIIAMAQKRSSVRSTIKATGVDALFSPGDGVTVDYYYDTDTDAPPPVKTQRTVDGDGVVTYTPEPNEKPATPKNPPPAATGSYKANIGTFKTRALKEVYGNNTYSMNASLEKRMSDGTLTDDMTVDQALDALKHRKEVKPEATKPEMPPASPEWEKLEQQLEDVPF